MASDNGVPPLSSTAMINIDISDVNDNPPLFSQANYSLIIQVSAGAPRGPPTPERRRKWGEVRGGIAWERKQREGLTGRNNGRLREQNFKMSWKREREQR